MTLSNAVGILRDEDAQASFLERFGNERPHLSGRAIDLAFRQSFREVAPQEHVETLERRMECLLGIVSDEEE